MTRRSLIPESPTVAGTPEGTHVYRDGIEVPNDGWVATFSTISGDEMARLYAMPTDVKTA